MHSARFQIIVAAAQLVAAAMMRTCDEHAWFVCAFYVCCDKLYTHVMIQAWQQEPLAECLPLC